MSASMKAALATERRAYHLRHLGAVLVLALVPAFGQAQNASLTLDQAIRLGVQHSASSLAAAASVAASREAAARAGQLPDPMLKLGVENLPVTGPDKYSLTQDFMTMRRVAIEQQWVSADKRSARSARGQRAVDAEEAAYLVNVARVRQQTALAWIDVDFAQRSLELLKALEKESDQDLATGQAALRGAKTGAAEVVQAQLALAQAGDRRRKGEQALNTARTALSRWVAVRVESVGGSLPPLTSHVADLPAGALETSHPLLLAARRSVTLADAETAVAATERQPDWSFEAGFAQRGSQYSNMVSVGISIPLPVSRAQRQDRDLAEKSALGTRARLQFDDVLRQLQADIQDQSLTLASLRQRVSRLERELLPSASQQVELALAAYRSNAGSLAAVFNARRMALEARMQILEVEKEAATTWAKLEFQLIPGELPALGRADQ